jgi:TonB family protein
MSLAERNIGLLDDLGFALDQAQSGNYAEALRLVGRAKLVDPRNIFIIALEKQIARLRIGGMLPREKVEILQSLPGLAERARADGERRGVARPAADHPPAPPLDEKLAKLRLVVEQYFQHADQWMAQGDYDGALKEIERVLLIEPGNSRVRDYRARIDQARRTATEKAAPALPAEIPPPPGSKKEEPAPALPVPDHAADKSPLPAETKEPKEKKSSIALWLMIAIALVAVGVALAMFLPKKQSATPANLGSSTPPVTEQTEPAQSLQPRSSGAEYDSPIEAPEVIVPIPPKTEREKKSEGSGPADRPAERSSERTVEGPAPGLVNAKPTAVTGRIGKPEPPSGSTPFIPIQKEPKILRLEHPSFSESDLSAGIRGEIVVKVQIDKSGKPMQARVVSSTNTLLNDPVVDAVMKSSFSPGIMSNGPVMSWMTIPFKFK